MVNSPVKYFTLSRRNTFIMSSLVILAIWLALTGAIYLQIVQFYAVNLFPNHWDSFTKKQQPIKFQGLIKELNQISRKSETTFEPA